MPFVPALLKFQDGDNRALTKFEAHQRGLGGLCDLPYCTPMKPALWIEKEDPVKDTDKEHSES